MLFKFNLLILKIHFVEKVAPYRKKKETSGEASYKIYIE